jgi:glycosyltransferase involved in cell wall biosynthesis
MTPDHAAVLSRSNPIENRPALAMVCNTLTPYRLNLHRILAREIPELELLTLVTHGDADFRWRSEAPEEIHVVHFARRGERAHGGPLVAPWTDWRKGGQLIRYFAQRNVAATIFTGYAYPSHLRLLSWLERKGRPAFLRNDANVYVDQTRSSWRRAIKRVFFRWAGRRAAGFMPMGELGERYFASYGVPLESMFRVPYTPDYDWFANADDAAIAEFMQRHGLAKGRRRFLYSGRLVPVKRVDLLLDAFARLADERPQWDLVIAGSGRMEQELRARVPARLEDRVRWTGFLEESELRAAYHACDVLVLPSEREAWGVVVQEAMAAGRPVVASHVVGAAHDLVVDGASGKIFPSGDGEALLTCLRETSDEAKLPGFQREASNRLNVWRSEVDVVANVRRALESVQALP